MRRRAETILIHFIGWLFVIAGVSFALVPLMPGIIFMIIGFYLISLRSEWIRRRFDRVAERFPHVGRVILKFETWFERFILSNFK